MEGYMYIYIGRGGGEGREMQLNGVDAKGPTYGAALGSAAILDGGDVVVKGELRLLLFL